MKIEEAIEKFLFDRSVYCAPRTVDYYRECLQMFVARSGCRDTKELSKEFMQRFIVNLRYTLKDTSIRTYCRALTVFGHWLEEEGIAASYPFRGLKLPKSDAELVTPLMQSEVETVLSYFDNRKADHFSAYDWKMWRGRILFLLLLDAGMRSQEARNLKVPDINLTQRFFRIRQSKGNKNRIVPMSEQLRELLSFYLPKLPNKTGYVLLPLRGNMNGRQAITENAVKAFFSKLKEETGILRIHAHLLRHTFATSYLYGGGNLEDLRLLLGHADYTVTKNYLHLSMEYKLTGAGIYRLDPVFFRKGY